MKRNIICFKSVNTNNFSESYFKECNAITEKCVKKITNYENFTEEYLTK